jgi:two-component system phosphate regulon sensor histidine kinase PhoR
MSTNPNPQELSGSLSRVNNLGTNTATFFSRLYQGLRRRSKVQEEIERQRRLSDQNRQLKRAVRSRDLEIERLNAILATIDEGVIMQDMQGRIALFNNAARALLGSQKAFWDSELGSLFNAYRDITTVDHELVPLGEPTRVQINNKIVGAQVAAVADDQGNRLGTMIVLRDVTRETLTERLQDQFVTAISHELRTPMAVIKGMSEVILGQPEGTPPNRRFLEALGRNVDILDRMIVELLDITEMSAGAFSIRQDSVDLEELIWSVVTSMTPEINRTQLDVAVMVKDAEHLRVTGDGQRLRWALGHLLQNAIRYNEAGGHIMVMARVNDEQHIAVQVVDTGVGISQKDLPYVFDRFYRGEPRTRSGKLLDPRGLGQGLFVARSVAEAHGGYLTVRSEQGHGSIFTMVLPAANAA